MAPAAFNPAFRVCVCVCACVCRNLLNPHGININIYIRIYLIFSQQKVNGFFRVLNLIRNSESPSTIYLYESMNFAWVFAKVRHATAKNKQK